MSIKIPCPACGVDVEVPQDGGNRRKRAMKACPFCAESIPRDAQKCHFCGEFLAYTSGGQSKPILTAIKRFFAGKRRQQAELLFIPAEKIEANPYQPREMVDKKTLSSLKKSMQQYGIIVPLIVKREGAGFQLVAGQRRLMAARELGMKFVPAIVKDLTVREIMEVSYLENLHRIDLTLIDNVQMFERICQEYPEIGRERLAAMLGLELDTIARNRDMLKFPVILQEALRRGMIDDNHARHLKTLDKQQMLHALEEIHRRRLDAEETEELVNRILKKKPKYVASRDGLHFHKSDCAYAKLLDPNEIHCYYSKQEALGGGKRPCMTCL